MNKREKCRCITTCIVALMAIAGCSAFIYGSVSMFRLSQEGLANDGGGVADILSFFTKCGDIQAPTGAWSSEVVSHAMKFQCMAKQLPARAAAGFAGAFMILALLCVPAAMKKDKMFGFTLWSTLSISTIVMSVVLVSIYALPAASSMAPNCEKYDSATIQELQNMGIVCLKGVEGQPTKTNALKWFCKLHAFYAGAALSIASLLLFFMIKTCCCCNASASCSSSSSSPASASASGCCTQNANGEPKCMIGRAVHKLKARFCRRSDPALASSVDRDDGLPVSAPSYYQVSPASVEGEVSEDAGVGGSQYYGVN